jgi:hypothetical protein
LRKKDKQAQKSEFGRAFGNIEQISWEASIQAKEKKTADELVALMKQQLGRDAFISVFKDPVYGWNAKIFAPPSKASGLQAILDEIVRVLRSQYDLEE